MKKINFYLLLTTLFLGVGVNAQGIYFVTDSTDSGSGKTLRNALASNADTIVIDVKGTLELTSSLVLTKDVVILGPSAKHFTINPWQITDVDGLFKFNGHKLTLSGVRISGGGYNSSVPILHIHNANNADTVRVIDCLFENTVLQNGSGSVLNYNVALLSKPIIFSRCSFISVRADNNGGAFYIAQGKGAEVYNCTFNACTTTWGQGGRAGAIYMSGGDLTLINNTFYMNSDDSDAHHLYLAGNSVNLINNIFEEGSTQNLIKTGTIVADYYHNNFISSYLTGAGISYGFTENTASGISTPLIEDGLGLKYFSLPAGSPCIDTYLGSNPKVLSQKYDQRRSWRKMKSDIANSSYSIDAGAVEYSPFTVTSADPNNSPGGIKSVFSRLNSSPVFGNKAIVFEIPTSDLPADMNIGQDTLVIDYSVADLIINGFSQSGSVVAGPGIDSTSVTSATIPIVINGNNTHGSIIENRGANVFIAGVDVINAISSGGIKGVGINFTGYNCSIEGCHIGVNSIGEYGSNTKNTYGITVPPGTQGLSIGVNNYYNNFLMHVSRNIISGNDSAQVESLTGGVIKRNFIGLNGTGTSVINTPFAKGVVLGSVDAYVGLFGGKKHEGNYVAGQDSACKLYNMQEVRSNVVGFLYDKVGIASNNTGIKIENGYDAKIINNRIGNVTNGNALYLLNIKGNNSFLYPEQNSVIAFNKIGITLNRQSAAINGSGIKILSNRGSDGNGGHISDARFRKIHHNVIANCNRGLDFDLSLFHLYDPNSGNYIPVPSLSVPFSDSVYRNVIGFDTINNNSFSNGTGIYIDSGVQAITFSRNIIANNTTAGVQIAGVDSTEYIHFYRNKIFNNGGATGLGIDLDDNGTTNLIGNKPYSNDSVVPPTLSSSIYCQGDSKVKLGVKLFIEDSTRFYRMDFYKTDSDGQEGKIFLKDTMFAPNTLSLGNNIDTLSFMATFIAINDSIVATLTQLDTATIENYGYLDTLLVASTSEFSNYSVIRNYSPSIVTPSGVCDGQQIIIQIADAGTITNFMIDNVSQLNNPAHYTLTTGQTSITVSVVSDSLGCSDSFTTSLSVNPLPNVTANIFNNRDTICQGDSAVLIGVPYNSTNGQWKVDSTSFTDTVVFPGNTTKYIYIFTDGNGCSNKDSVVVTVNPLPNAILVSDSVVCYGNTIDLSGLVSSVIQVGETSYWYNESDATSTPLIAQTIIMSQDSSFVYQVTDVSSGCINQDTINILVNSLPNVSAGMDSSICGSGDIYLSGLNGITPTTGIWYDITMTNFINSTNVVSVISDTSFIYRVTDGNGCTNQDTVDIFVNSLPNVSAGQDSIICGLGTINLMGLIGVNPLNGTWYDNTMSNTIPNPVSVSLNTSYIYKVIGVDGCMNQDTVDIFVNPLPNVSAGQDSSICGMGTINLNGLIGVTPSNGTWYDTTMISIANNNINVVSDTSFIYQVTAGNGCTNQDTVDIFVNPKPILTVNSTTPDNCSDGSGEVVLLTTSGTPSYSYSIDGATYNLNNVFSGLQGGQSYTFYTIDDNNCSDTLAIYVPVGTSTPPLSPSLITPIKICQGYKETITDTISTNANYAHTFIFYDFPDEINVNSTNNAVLIPESLNGVDSIVVVATNTDGCTNSTTITDIDFTENNLQTSPINNICQGDNHTFDVWATGVPDSLLWSTNGTGSGEQEDQGSFTINNLTDNEVYIAVKENDCWFYDTISVTFAIDCEETVTNAFQPDGDIEENSFFYLDDEHVNPDLWENTVTIYNRWGDIVFKEQNYDNKTIVWKGKGLTRVDLPEGTYYYVLDVPEISYSKKGWVYLDR